MPWQKANPKLIGLLEESVIKYPCDRRFMFGSPTFFVGDEIFFGKDRLREVEEMIGERSSS